MANLCDTIIGANIDFACSALAVKGMEADGIIMNRSEIDFASTTFDSTDPNVIKTLVMKAGKKAYEVVQIGNTPFTGLTSELQVGTYRNTWTHTIPIAVLSNDPDVCNDIIDGLSNGNFVLILKNKYKGTGGNAEYQVYGYYQGCVASAGSRDVYSEETEGGWLITLQEANTPKSGVFFFNTDAATTAAAFEALKIATP